MVDSKIEPEVNAALQSHFKHSGITLEDIAEKTGYSLQYILNMMNGHEPVTSAAKWRFINAFPATAPLLTPQCPTCGPVR